MELEAIQQYCQQFKGVTEDIKWDVHLAFCVGGKIFLIADLEEPFGYAFKTTPEDFEELTSRGGIIPAPHLARASWVKLTGRNALPRKELEQYISRSYTLISAKLTKKLRLELGI
jgi:predicted DNA-binding protein (MmcQ/YjbR family)